MSNVNNTLTDAEVRQISSLIESLDKSGLDYLQIDADGVKVTISKSGALPVAAAAAPTVAVAASPVAVAVAPATTPRQATPTSASAPPATAASASQEGTLPITAPLLGRFYSKPDPASPPFVTVGSAVDLETPVGLIEVMKLFNTVQAGVRGTITEICVPDGEFIEYGSVIFRVRPS